LRPAEKANKEKMALARAVNVVVDRRYFGEYAVGIEGSREYKDEDRVVQRGKRLFFFVPWRGKTMIGTTYRLSELTEAPPLSSKNDIEEMLDEVNALYPAANLSPQDVVFSHVGLVPAYSAETKEQNDNPRLLKHSEIIDQQDGVLSVRGVKYTTALQLARDLEKLLSDKGLSPTSPEVRRVNAKSKKTSQTHSSLLEQFPHLTDQYGEQSVMILQIMKDEPESQTLLCAEPPLSVAEVLYGVRDEMACHLTDLVLRRSELGSCGIPEEPVLRRIAEVMARELQWSEEQCQQELDATAEIYENMHVRLP